MKAKRIVLGDDGTMDTVVYCRECYREYRGTFDGSDRNYKAFIKYLIESVEEDHICEGDDDDV